jgi:enoyl-CoA hydratase/carnithine racemase
MTLSARAQRVGAWQHCQMSDRVSCVVADGVADVRMTRGDKMNALDAAMFEALAAVGAQLKTEPGLRAVVLSGEGRSFCAGLDMGSFQVMAGGTASEENFNAGRMTPNGLTHLAQQICWVWQEIPVPVIAAVHGAALGGGAQLALGADIRIMAPDAKFSILEIKWGLVPDMTGTFRLAQLVRPDIAMELATTGRILNGVEAEHLGLATRVSSSPLHDALAMAREIASKSPHAVRGVKELLGSAYAGADAATQFAHERQVIRTLIGSPNQVESVMAAFEQRHGQFSDI